MKTLLYIFSVITFSACGSKPADRAAVPPIEGNSITLTQPQINNAGIAIGSLEQKAINNVLRLTGSIDVPPQNMVSISMPLGGYLKSTHLLPGMHVKKGEVIATMEDQQYVQLQQDYLTTKATLQLLEQEFQRQRNLNESKASSDKVYQQTSTDLKTEQIKLKGISEKLLLAGIQPAALAGGNISRQVNIHSPIDGYVTKINVNIGKYVSPTDVLFELVNPADIHLGLKVFEKDLDQLQIGQTVLAYTNSNPSKKYTCKVLLIGKYLSTERSVEVHCHFEQYDHVLIPGTFMNAELPTTNRMQWVLPEDAVVSFEKKQYAFVEDQANQFTMVEVTAGVTENGYTVINDPTPLQQKKVVVKGAYTLLMALKNKSDEE